MYCAQEQLKCVSELYNWNSYVTQARVVAVKNTNLFMVR